MMGNGSGVWLLRDIANFCSLIEKITRKYSLQEAEGAYFQIQIEEDF